MSRPLLIALLLVAGAGGVALALTLGQDEPGSRGSERTATDAASTEGWTVTSDVTLGIETGEEPKPDTSPAQPDPQRLAIERAVALFIESAERDSPSVGLPNSDELSIEAIAVRGGTARVRLAGGARLHLKRSGSTWQVVKVDPAEPIPPSPPSELP